MSKQPEQERTYLHETSKSFDTYLQLTYPRVNGLLHQANTTQQATVCL